MAAHYDTYDYPSYWNGRDYEHCSEEIVLQEFLKITKKVPSIIDIGGGFGRLTPLYKDYATHITISDPSSKLLTIAKNNNADKKCEFVKGTLDTICASKKTYNLVLMIRVMHHIPNVTHAISCLHTIVKPNGYLILEFANKRHFKSVCSELAKGNFSYTSDMRPKEIKSETTRSKKTIPFFNYHPHVVIKALNDEGFEIIAVRSVSNLRSFFLKRYLPKGVLVFIERHLQKLLAPLFFGPSIFVLAKRD